MVGKEKKNMTRAMLRELGLTDEQIDAIMAEHGKDIQAERSKVEKDKTDSLKVNELLKQIENMKNEKANVDKDMESKNTELDSIQKELEKVKAEMKNEKLKASLAEKGIVGEHAEKLITGLNEGNLDVDTLGAILTSASQSAVDAKVKELEGNAINPNGGKAEAPVEKSDGEKMAESIGNNLAEANKASADVLAQYI